MFDFQSLRDRIEKLGLVERRALAWVVLDLRQRRQNTALEEDMQRFVLPLAEMGLTLAQMMALVEKVPDGWPLDHREIYFDFRLQRWMRILDAPTIDECLEDYVKHADSEIQGLDYLEGRIRAFFARHGRDWPVVGAEAGGFKNSG